MDKPMESAAMLGSSGMVHLVALLAVTSVLVSGEYDSMEKARKKALPSRIAAISSTLMDASVFQEVMFNVLSYALPTLSANPLCANHSNAVQQAFLQGQEWAFLMMDASTSLAPGMLQRDVMTLGSYDQCLAVEQSAQFQGRLCVVVTKDLLPEIRPLSEENSQMRVVPEITLRFSFATCVPSSCSPADVQAHWQQVLGEFNATAQVSSTDCSVHGDVPPTTATFVALYVCAVLLLAVFISTCYDYSVGHQPPNGRRILLCFSAHYNLQKLFQPEERRCNNLDMLDGLRVLAMWWIILGHRFEMSLQFPSFSFIQLEKYITAWFMSPITNTMLGVEVFFLLSGCLLTYNFLNSHGKGHSFNLLHFYYKRICRLTFPLAFVVMVEGCLLPHFSDGPLWKKYIGFRVESCTKNWWSTLLYVSNLVNPYRVCVAQTWYISVDMQLYLLAPLLLLPLTTHRRGGHLLAVCYVGTTVATLANAYYYELRSGAFYTVDNKTEPNYGLEYTKTYTRAGSWLTGVALGYILHSWPSHQRQISKKTAVTGCSISLLLCVLSVYSIAPFQSVQYRYSPLVDSLHIALHRNVFALGVAGVVVLCHGGSAVWINDLLTWRAFRPLSTLTYGVYLCHMGLQVADFAMLRQTYNFTMYSMFVGFLSDLLIANLVAALLYISVEGPFSEISKWLYSPRKEDPKVNVNTPLEKIKQENEQSTL